MRVMDVKPTPFVQSIRCDRCGVENHHEDLEFAEFVSIDHRCGYATIQNDGKHIQVDLCYACFKEVLGPYWQVKSDWIGALGSAVDAKDLS